MVTYYFLICGQVCWWHGFSIQLLIGHMWSRLICLTFWDMKAQSAWKAEAAVVTAQRKKIGGGGWFSKAILEEGHPVWIRGGVEL